MDFFAGNYPETYEPYGDETFRRRYFSFRGRLNRNRYVARQILVWFVSLVSGPVLENYIYTAEPTPLPAPNVWESVFHWAGGTAYAASSVLPVAASYFTLSVFTFLYFLITIGCSLASVLLNIRRAHDRDHSGWYLLLCCIPLVNFVILFQLHSLRGTRGPNRFGPDPEDQPDRPLL